MINFKNFLTRQNLIPSILILVFLVLGIINLVPESPLLAGTVCYEKNNYGYQPVMTTSKSNQVRVHRLAGDFAQVEIKDLPTKLWVATRAIDSKFPFPARLFIKTRDGQTDPTTPPFVEKTLTISYGSSSRAQGGQTSQASVHLLFSLFLLAVFLLSLKSQVLKNSLAVLIGIFLMFYAVYAAGLAKAGLDSPEAKISRVLDLVQPEKEALILCESADLLKISQSRHGTRVKSALIGSSEVTTPCYYLTRTPLGSGWKLLATDGQVYLYYRG